MKLKLSKFYIIQIYKWAGVRVIYQYFLEQIAAWSKDNLMGFDLFIIYCGNSDIHEMFVICKLSKSFGSEPVEPVVTQRKNLISHGYNVHSLIGVVFDGLWKTWNVYQISGS